MVFFQQWKSLSRISFLRPSQHRWNYQIFIEKVRNKKTGKLEMEDVRKYFQAAPDMNLHSDRTFTITIRIYTWVSVQGAQCQDGFHINFAWFLTSMHLTLFPFCMIASKPDLLQYEKPWMKRKRKKQNRLYNKKAHNIRDLMAFIKVKQDSTKKNK